MQRELDFEEIAAKIKVVHLTGRSLGLVLVGDPHKTKHLWESRVEVQRNIHICNSAAFVKGGAKLCRGRIGGQIADFERREILQINRRLSRHERQTSRTTQDKRANF